MTVEGKYQWKKILRELFNATQTRLEKETLNITSEKRKEREKWQIQKYSSSAPSHNRNKSHKNSVFPRRNILLTLLTSWANRTSRLWKLDGVQSTVHPQLPPSCLFGTSRGRGEEEEEEMEEKKEEKVGIRYGVVGGMVWGYCLLGDLSSNTSRQATSQPRPRASRLPLRGQLPPPVEIKNSLYYTSHSVPSDPEPTASSLSPLRFLPLHPRGPT